MIFGGRTIAISSRRRKLGLSRIDTARCAVDTKLYLRCTPVRRQGCESHGKLAKTALAKVELAIVLVLGFGAVAICGRWSSHVAIDVSLLPDTG